MPPAGFVRINCSIRGLSERRQTYSPAFLGLGISTVCNRCPILLCSLTGLSEAHSRIAT